MGRGYRRKNWSFVGMIGLAMLAMVSIGVSLIEYYELKEYRKAVSELRSQLDSYQRVVYVAAEKLPKGTVLTSEKLWKEIRYFDCPQEEFITEDMFGMVLTQDVTEGTCLFSSMLCSVEEDVREVFLEEAELPEHVQTGDRIDVRIRYDNAEDYVVLSDKVLVKCETGRGMVITLSEEEILLLSSAIADSETYTNTRLYVVEYPEYKLTEAGEVTYIANRNVLALLDRENMEGESRDALEQRLMQKK